MNIPALFCRRTYEEIKKVTAPSTVEKAISLGLSFKTSIHSWDIESQTTIIYKCAKCGKIHVIEIKT